MNEDTLDVESADVDTQQEESQDEGGNWEKRYKDLQRYTTKVSQESKVLRDEINQLKGMMTAIQTQGAPDNANHKEEDWLSEVKGVDLIDNPDKLVEVLDRVRKEERKKYIDLLELRDKSYDEKINTISPRTIQAKQLVEEYKDEIAAMKEDDPDLEDVSDLTLAKVIAKQKPRKEEESPSMFPQIGGKRTMTKSSASAFEKAIDARVKEMYPEELGFK